MADETVETTQDIENNELLPPEGQNVGRKVFTILEEVLEEKKNLNLPENWAYWYRLGRNKHWIAGSKKASLVSANLLHRHRTQSVNMLTENNPTFETKLVGEIQPGQQENVQNLVHATQHWWIEEEQQSVFRDSVLNGETYGCFIEKMVWNDEYEYHRGEAETIVVDPFHFGFYPTKELNPKKWQAVLHYYPVTVRDLRRQHPEQADKIKSDRQYLEELGDDRMEVQTGKPSSTKSWFTSISSVIKEMVAGNTGGSNVADDWTLCVECWVKDYTMVTEERPEIIEDMEGDALTQEELTVTVGEQIPKYKGYIRMVKCCNGGEVVLEDRSNPSINPEMPDEQAQKTYLYSRFPFIFGHSVRDTSNPWGMSDFSQLEQLNIEVNKTLSQFNLFKDKAARLKIINPRDSGVPNEQFSNYPGIINPSNAIVAAGIRYMDPPQMPMDLKVIGDLYVKLFYDIAGTFDLEQAQSSGRDVIAYKAIATLLEHASRMMRGKIENYTKGLRERGRMYISMVQNWYIETSPEQGRYVEWEEDGESQVSQIRGQELIVPAKLTVVSGSTMPVSQVQRREEAIDLFGKGAIDGEELLKNGLQWGNWREVVNRMKQGPFADLMGKLEAIGAPPQFLQILPELLQMDEKEFERAIKDEKIPPFAMLAQPGQEEGPDPMEQMELAGKQAEIEANQAKVEAELAKARKSDADAALAREKIITEQINQAVSIQGVKLVWENIKIERAKMVKELLTPDKDATYREKGMKSNNKQK